MSGDRLNNACVTLHRLRWSVVLEHANPWNLRKAGLTTVLSRDNTPIAVLYCFKRNAQAVGTIVITTSWSLRSAVRLVRSYGGCMYASSHSYGRYLYASTHKAIRSKATVQLGAKINAFTYLDLQRRNYRNVIDLPGTWTMDY